MRIQKPPPYPSGARTPTTTAAHADTSVAVGANLVTMCPLRRDDEGVVQIPPEHLLSDPPTVASMFGPWERDISALAERFQRASPFPHVVIDDFFAPDLARRLLSDFPAPNADLWHVYDNPLEQKLACGTTAIMPPTLREVVFALCGPAVVETMRRLSGIGADAGLQADRYCHGGGIHCHPAGGKLDVHLDYSLHPVSGEPCDHPAPPPHTPLLPTRSSR